MNILVSGLGSIGKRHLDNLVSLGFKDIYLCRSSTSPTKIGSDFTEYSSLERALDDRKYEYILICNPTSFHVDIATRVLKKSEAKLLIEKPLSHDWRGVSELRELIKQNNSSVQIGFDLRFDAGLNKVKELLSNDVIGKPVQINAHVGQYLPDWRPNQDYREGYSAKKDYGGGVLLDLVHEIDYVTWLIGEVESIACFNDKLGDLQIETEDTAGILLKFKTGSIGTISMDYHQRHLSRGCKVVGTRGTINWDYNQNRVMWYHDNSVDVSTFDYTQNSRNDRFIEEIKYFVGVEKVNYEVAEIDDGVNSLRLVLAAKASNDQKRIIDMNDFNPS